MSHHEVAETYLDLWESLCQGRDGTDRGPRLKIRVVDTILFRGGRPYLWIFTDKDGEIKSKLKKRLQWPEMVRHLLRLLPQKACNDEPAAVLRYSDRRKAKALQTTVLTRRELRDLGGSPASCGTALGGGELVSLQAAPLPRMGDSTGIYHHAFRSERPHATETALLRLDDPGRVVAVATASTRELFEWPEKPTTRAAAPLQRSRAGDAGAMRIHRCLEHATAAVVAHVALVRGAAPISGLAAEFCFDARGAPCLCHCADVGRSLSDVGARAARQAAPLRPLTNAPAPAPAPAKARAATTPKAPTGDVSDAYVSPVSPEDGRRQSAWDVDDRGSFLDYSPDPKHHRRPSSAPARRGSRAAPAPAPPENSSNRLTPAGKPELSGSRSDSALAVRAEAKKFKARAMATLDAPSLIQLSHARELFREEDTAAKKDRPGSPNYRKKTLGNRRYLEATERQTPEILLRPRPVNQRVLASETAVVRAGAGRARDVPNFKGSRSARFG